MQLNCYKVSSLVWNIALRKVPSNLIDEEWVGDLLAEVEKAVIEEQNNGLSSLLKG